MKTLDEVIKILKNRKSELKTKYNVKEIGIFGSYVKGEQTKDSDLDILVEFGSPISLFEFIDLEEYFEALTKTKVDLVSKKALKPFIKGYILKEVIYL